MRTLINAMPDIVAFKDGEGRWLEANRFDLQLFQLESVDYRGKKDSDLAAFSSFYREAFLACEESDELAWQARKPSRADETIPRPDGPPMVFDIIKVPMFYPDGRRKGLVVVGRDITERKLAEAELKKY
ncbi:MAG: PAS domain S-box protein [Geobacter sp.]|nr:MAG: PAS domain S-box protein [Geobacter sp.]